MSTARQSALCSPDFLHVGPSTRDGPALDEFALAERLSYFLWSSLPDDVLRESAARGGLHDASQLLAEADRLFADSRSDALAADFAAQWLMIEEFDRFAPDRELYPDFYRPELAGLDEDLKAEPGRRFGQVAAFLGMAATPARLEKAIRFSSFETLRKLEDRTGFIERTPVQDRFFRKGAVGEWRAKLSRAQIRRVVERHREQMLRFDYLPEDD